MSDKHFESENRGKIPEKPVLWIIVRLTSRGRLKNV